MGSRWLDPSEVEKGPEMQLQWWGWPCQVAHEFAGDGVRIDGHGPGRCSSFVKLGPSPLVAAPRWSGKPIRARRGIERHDTGNANWAWSFPGPAYTWKTKRVFAVRPFNPGSGADWRAQWLVAL